MAAPKRKLHDPTHAPRPTHAEREAAEMRGDVAAYDLAKAEWEADGRPAPVPLAEVKRRLGLK